ncbi:MAG TPA: DUF4232 domain-containing protein [Streptosporangiaceae bacterium]|nr:DUF4232 domain-containing protein [Streptosporangiaceae bacterium]
MSSTCSPGQRRPAVLGLCGLAVAAALLLCACGLQKSPASGADRQAGKTAGADRACTASAIHVVLDARSAGVAAGTSVIPLDFTNSSALSCRLGGFAAVTFAAAQNGGQVGAAAAADRSLGAAKLVLRSGMTAHIWLRILDVANLPPALCRPVTVAGLRVRLPGQGSAIFISHPLLTCSRHVLGTDILTVEPFKPGRALPGTAQ